MVIFPAEIHYFIIECHRYISLFILSVVLDQQQLKIPVNSVAAVEYCD